MNPLLMFAAVSNGFSRLSMMNMNRPKPAEIKHASEHTYTNPIMEFRRTYGEEMMWKHMDTLVKQHYPQCYENWSKNQKLSEWKERNLKKD